MSETSPFPQRTGSGGGRSGSNRGRRSLTAASSSSSAAPQPRPEEMLRGLLSESARTSIESGRRSSVELAAPPPAIIGDPQAVVVPPIYAAPPPPEIVEVAAEEHQVHQAVIVPPIYAAPPPPEIAEVAVEEQQQQIPGGNHGEGPRPLEVDAPRADPEANAEHIPHVPCYILCALVLFVFLESLLRTYETTAFGGAFISLGFLDIFSPILKYRDNLFRENNFCTYYNFQTQMVNSCFHIAAGAAILLVELCTRTRARVLYLALVGSFVHGIGSLLTGVAKGELAYGLIVAGRICSGFGIGLLKQCAIKTMDVIKPNSNYVTAAKVLQILAGLLGPIASNALNLYGGLHHPDTYWRQSLGLPGVVSAFVALVSSLVLLLAWWNGSALAWRNSSAPDTWSRPTTVKTTVTYPLLIIEAVKTVCTPVLDLNLYNQVISILFTPSDLVTYGVPLGVSIYQSSCLAVSWAVSHFCTGVRVNWQITAIIGLCQAVTGVIAFIQKAHRRISIIRGIVALVLQGFFVAGYAHLSSPLGWIDFPDDSVEAMSPYLSAASMLLQGCIAYLTPYIACKTAPAMYVIWAFSALIVAGFIYVSVPDIREASDEMREEKFRSHGMWKYWYAWFGF